jgi:hypothetical protein
MNKEKMFITRDENNVEVAYEMLYVKNVDNTPVIWYTDGSLDEEGNENVYISTYERQGNTFVLNSIDDEAVLNKYADIFLNEYKEN